MWILQGANDFSKLSVEALNVSPIVAYTRLAMGMHYFTSLLQIIRRKLQQLCFFDDHAGQTGTDAPSAICTTFSRSYPHRRQS